MTFSAVEPEIVTIKVDASKYEYAEPDSSVGRMEEDVEEASEDLEATNPADDVEMVTPNSGGNGRNDSEDDVCSNSISHPDSNVMSSDSTQAIPSQCREVYQSHAENVFEVESAKDIEIQEEPLDDDEITIDEDEMESVHEESSSSGGVEDDTVDDLLKDDESESDFEMEDSTENTSKTVNKSFVVEDDDVVRVLSMQPERGSPDISFLEGVNQDFSEVSKDNDSEICENVEIQKQILDQIVDQGGNDDKAKSIKRLKLVRSSREIASEARIRGCQVMIEANIPKTDENKSKALKNAFGSKINKRKSSESSQSKRKKFKMNKISSMPSPLVAKRVETHDQVESHVETTEKLSCPFSKCHFYTKSAKSQPHIYYILKHFISDHLSQSPCKLYESKRLNSKAFTCQADTSCTYTNESKTSYFAHLAFQHGDLLKRFTEQFKVVSNDPKGVAILQKINEFLLQEWSEWRSYDLHLSSNSSASSCAEDEILESQGLANNNDENSSNDFNDNIDCPANAGADSYVGQENEASSQNSSPPPENISPESSQEEDVTLVCRHCPYVHKDDPSLKEHILDEHAGEYRDIVLMAGEKFYECVDINSCNYKTKSKMTFMKHSKSKHGHIYVGLISYEDAWNDRLLKATDFCTAASSPRPKLDMHVSESRPELDMHAVHDYNPFDQRSLLKKTRRSRSVLEQPSPASPPNTNDVEPQNLASSPVRSMEDVTETPGPHSPTESPISDDDDIIEEYSFIRSPTVRKTRRPEVGNTCKVCDIELGDGREVSQHVFEVHLQHTVQDDVWHDLYSAEAGNTFTCKLCSVTIRREVLAKLHFYNKHKRELKHKMDEKGVDWRNLLDFIQFSIDERKIVDDEEPEDNSEKAKEDADIIISIEIPSPVEEKNPENPGCEDDPMRNVSPVSSADSVQIEESSADNCQAGHSSAVDSLQKGGAPADIGDCSVAGNEVKAPSGSTEELDSSIEEGQIVEDADSPSKEQQSNSVSSSSILEQHQHGDQDSQKLFQCPFLYCTKSFPKAMSLMEHYTLVHKDSTLTVLLMGKLFPKQFDLSQKVEETKIKLQNGFSQCFYLCTDETCLSSFSTIEDLEDHKKCHNGEEERCDGCRRFFTNSKCGQMSECPHRGEIERIEELRRRRLTVHCTHRRSGCGRVFTNRDELHSHASKCRHGPRERLRCGECGKRFYYADELAAHRADKHA